MSNLKQIGLGIMQYAQDNDEKLFGSASGGVWPLVLQPYTKSTAIFSCASADAFLAYGAQNYGAQLTGIPYHGGYSLNCTNFQESYPNEPHLLVSGIGSPAIFTAPGYPLVFFQAPTQTILMGDAQPTGNAGGGYNGWPGYGYWVYGDFLGQVIGLQLNVPIGSDYPTSYDHLGDAGAQQGRFGGRHFNGANFAFADGHVKWMSIKQALAATPRYKYFSAVAY